MYSTLKDASHVWAHGSGVHGTQARDARMSSTGHTKKACASNSSPHNLDKGSRRQRRLTKSSTSSDTDAKSTSSRLPSAKATIFSHTRKSVAPVNGNRPVDSWNTRQPRAHRSHFVVVLSPSSTSGDTYSAVPSKLPALCPDVRSSTAPKSPSLHRPLLSISTFSGFRSL